MNLLKYPVVIIVLTQVLFTSSDLLARANLKNNPISISTFLTGWFILYFVIRQAAMIGQLYVFSNIEVGKTMALFGATSIVLVNVLGFLLLSEILSTQAYIGVAFAVVSFIVLAFSP